MARSRGRVHFGDLADDATLTVLPSTETSPTTAPVDQLAHNPENPRYGYDDVDELSAVLVEGGQLQPLAVVHREIFLAHYPQHEATVGTAAWVVINGNRRLAAARKAGLPELMISVQDRLGGKDQRFTESALIENIHRQALPPLLEARELEALVQRHGSQSAVARRIGKSQGWISQRLALLKLIPELQERLRRGGITVEEGRAVAAKPADEQTATLALLRRNRSERANDEAAGLLRRNSPGAEEEAPATDGPVAGSRPGDRNQRPAQNERTTRVSIRVTNIEDAAVDLRKHFTPDQLLELLALLKKQL